MRYTREFFEQRIDRMGTDNIKWDAARAESGPDAVPMWIADMDFPSPPAIVNALLSRAAHPFYGYTRFSEELKAALCAFWQRRHETAIAPETVEIIPSVVAGMNLALRAVSEPGERILIQTPLYGPFAASIRATGRTVYDCPMLQDEAGRYTMDFAAIEQAFQSGVRVMMLCNPHNPAARNWTEGELRQLAALLTRYEVTLISDEIHADFTYDAPMLSMLRLLPARVLMLTAPSKTFNVAGLNTAFAVCPDADLHAKLTAAMESVGIHGGNIFGMTAALAAYTACDDWLDGLLDYLRAGRDGLQAMLADYLPKARLTPVEATYLAWVDLRAYGLTDEEIKARTHQAGVWFNPGTDFGANGSGYIRVNFACPHAQLAEAILRLAEALNGAES